MGFKINVEVPLLLTFFGTVLIDSLLGNLVIYRTCYVTLGYNETLCAQLGEESNAATAELEKLVQPRAAVINMVRGVVEGCVCAVMCTFVGPWSDKFGRRPVLLLVASAFFANLILVTIYSSFDLSAWYLLIVTIPYMACGGFSTYLAAVFSYVTDSTPEKNRGLRMSILEATTSAGMLLGTLTSSHVLYSVGYVYSCIIGTCFMLLALIYTIFFVPESLANIETDQNKFKGFFDTTNIKEMLKSPIKPREGYNRSIVILTICIQTILVFNVLGAGNVFNLFLREKFHFTLEQYTNYNSLTSLIWIAGSSIGVYLLHKLLKVPESVLILCGHISLIDSTLLYGLAKTNGVLYAAGGFKFLGALLGPMARSLISKRVHRDEIGKIFSFMMMIHALFTLASGPVYVAIYNSTIDNDPAMFFFVTAGFYTLNAVLISIVILLQNLWRFSKYTPLVDENEVNNGAIPSSSNVLISATAVST